LAGRRAAISALSVAMNDDGRCVGTREEIWNRAFLRCGTSGRGPANVPHRPSGPNPLGCFSPPPLTGGRRPDRLHLPTAVPGYTKDSVLFLIHRFERLSTTMTSETIPHVPVVIVGGGCCGLTLSILLSDLGIKSAVYETYPGTLKLPKAHYLNPRTLEVWRLFTPYTTPGSGSTSHIRRQTIRCGRLCIRRRS
jgi:hypothetical protein